MAAHRAWRVVIDSTYDNGRHCAVANEIEFLDGPGGTDLTNGAVGTAIGSQECFGTGGYAGAFANDGDASYWHSCCDPMPQWIGWDSGVTSADWFEPELFSWTSRTSGEYGPKDSIKTGGLEWSDDLVTWTRVYSLLPQSSFGSNERRELPYIVPPANDPGGHRYWRLLQYRNSTSQTGIAELEMAQTPGGVNLCTIVGGVGSSDGSYGGFYGPDRAFNGDRGNGAGEWGVNGGINSEHWLKFDFGVGSAFLVNEVRVCPFSDNGGTPRIFAIQWSDDDATWTTHFWGVYDGTYTFGSATSFTKPTPGPSHRYLGFFSTKSAGEKYYGQAAGSYLDLVACEVEMAAAVAGADLTTGGTGHWYPSSDGPGALFDGVPTSEAYNGGGGCKYCAVWYDFGSPVTIGEVRYRRGTGYNSNYYRSPAEGLLIYSDDGRAWLVGNGFTDVAYIDDGVTDRNIGSIVFDAIPGDGDPVERRRRAIVIC